jgi:hypothetical protein
MKELLLITALIIQFYGSNGAAWYASLPLNSSLPEGTSNTIQTNDSAADVTRFSIPSKDARNAELNHVTLERLISTTLKVNVKDFVTPPEGAMLNCSVSETPYIKLGQLDGSLEKSTKLVDSSSNIVISVSLTARGILGQTTLNVTCHVENANHTQDSDSDFLSVSIPLSFTRSAREKTSHSAPGYFLMAVNLLLMFSLGCRVTTEQVMNRLIGGFSILMLNSIVEPVVSIYFSSSDYRVPLGTLSTLT